MQRDIEYKVYVGNLPPKTIQSDLEAIFECIKGDISTVRLIYHRETNDFKGYCYVEFKTQEALDTALTFNGALFNDRVIKVHVPKDKNSFRPGTGVHGNSGYGNSRGGYSNDRVTNNHARSYNNNPPAVAGGTYGNNNHHYDRNYNNNYNNRGSGGYESSYQQQGAYDNRGNNYDGANYRGGRGNYNDSVSAVGHYQQPNYGHQNPNYHGGSYRGGYDRPGHYENNRSGYGGRYNNNNNNNSSFHRGGGGGGGYANYSRRDRRDNYHNNNHAGGGTVADVPIEPVKPAEGRPKLELKKRDPTLDAAANDPEKVLADAKSRASIFGNALPREFNVARKDPEKAAQVLSPTAIAAAASPQQEAAAGDSGAASVQQTAD